MAFKDFRRAERQDDVEEKAPAEPQGTYIDQGCELSGKLRFDDSVRIDGRIEGEIDCAKTLTVGETARLDALIRCESIVVYGEIQGDVEAQRKITLHKSARVVGEMQTAGIVIEEGARFKGQIIIGSDDAPSPRSAADAPTQPDVGD